MSFSFLHRRTDLAIDAAVGLYVQLELYITCWNLGAMGWLPFSIMKFNSMSAKASRETFVSV